MKRIVSVLKTYSTVLATIHSDIYVPFVLNRWNLDDKRKFKKIKTTVIFCQLWLLTFPFYSLELGRKICVCISVLQTSFQTSHCYVFFSPHPIKYSQTPPLSVLLKHPTLSASTALNSNVCFRPTPLNLPKPFTSKTSPVSLLWVLP